MDPVTGMYAKPQEPVHMTDEEKEHAAHEAMVLMHKMEKLGMVPKTL